MKKIYYLVKSAKKLILKKMRQSICYLKKLTSIHWNCVTIIAYIITIDCFLLETGYRVTGIRQKKKNFLVIQSDPVQRLLSEIFYRIEDAVKKENLVNLFCSPGEIQIDGSRLPLGKITYFKDCKKKFVSDVVLKTVLFVTNLNIYINSTCTTLTMKEAYCHGRLI